MRKHSLAFRLSWDDVRLRTIVSLPNKWNYIAQRIRNANFPIKLFTRNEIHFRRLVFVNFFLHGDYFIKTQIIHWISEIETCVSRMKLTVLSSKAGRFTSATQVHVESFSLTSLSIYEASDSAVFFTNENIHLKCHNILDRPLTRFIWAINSSIHNFNYNRSLKLRL